MPAWVVTRSLPTRRRIILRRRWQNNYFSLRTDHDMLESDYSIPIIISVVTALLIGGLYLFSTFFKDGDDE